MEDLLRRTLGEKIELQLELTGELWLTRCASICWRGRDRRPNATQTYDVAGDIKELAAEVWPARLRRSNYLGLVAPASAVNAILVPSGLMPPVRDARSRLERYIPWNPWEIGGMRLRNRTGDAHALWNSDGRSVLLGRSVGARKSEVRRDA
jgi:hypothetical protein